MGSAITSPPPARSPALRAFGCPVPSPTLMAPAPATQTPTERLCCQVAPEPAPASAPPLGWLPASRVRGAGRDEEGTGRGDGEERRGREGWCGRGLGEGRGLCSTSEPCLRLDRSGTWLGACLAGPEWAGPLQGRVQLCLGFWRSHFLSRPAGLVRAQPAPLCARSLLLYPGTQEGMGGVPRCPATSSSPRGYSSTVQFYPATSKGQRPDLPPPPGSSPVPDRGVDPVDSWKNRRKGSVKDPLLPSKY